MDHHNQQINKQFKCCILNWPTLLLYCRREVQCNPLQLSRYLSISVDKNTSLACRPSSKFSGVMGSIPFRINIIYMFLIQSLHIVSLQKIFQGEIALMLILLFSNEDSRESRQIKLKYCINKWLKRIVFRSLKQKLPFIDYPCKSKMYF